MQNKMKLDYEELREQAVRAVDESDFTQSRLAMELNVSTGAISRALSESGSKFSSLQQRIIEYLTPYRVEQHVVFEVQRKYATKDGARRDGDSSS